MARHRLTILVAVALLVAAAAVTQVGNRAEPVSDTAFAANGVTPFEVDIDVVVAWDGAGLDVDETPRLPTMAQSADYFFAPEPSPTEAPDPEADTGTYRRSVEASGSPCTTPWRGWTAT